MHSYSAYTISPSHPSGMSVAMLQVEILLQFGQRRSVNNTHVTRLFGRQPWPVPVYTWLMRMTPTAEQSPWNCGWALVMQNGIICMDITRGCRNGFVGMVVCTICIDARCLTTCQKYVLYAVLRYVVKSFQMTWNCGWAVSLQWFRPAGREVVGAKSVWMESGDITFSSPNSIQRWGWCIHS